MGPLFWLVGGLFIGAFLGKVEMSPFGKWKGTMSLGKENLLITEVHSSGSQVSAAECDSCSDALGVSLSLSAVCVHSWLGVNTKIR